MRPAEGRDRSRHEGERPDDAEGGAGDGRAGRESDGHTANVGTRRSQGEPPRPNGAVEHPDAAADADTRQVFRVAY
ncbi:hypothetical protein GCM10010372_76310 [Streptomyces tauricus]|nr:hypothetical protein GCM10010372_76310 [Streptomyces tauricus]